VAYGATPVDPVPEATLLTLIVSVAMPAAIALILGTAALVQHLRTPSATLAAVPSYGTLGGTL